MWPLWKTVQQFFQKLRTQLPCNYWVKYYMPKRNETVLKRYLYTHVYSSIIHNSQKVEQPKCPSTDKWPTKLWYISKKEYCSDTKRKVLIHAITWMNLKNTVLSERSQTFRIIYCMTPFT